MDITCVNYVKKKHVKPTHALLVEKLKKTSNDETIKCGNKKILLDFFINTEILVVHLINYIAFNNSLHHITNLDRPDHN